jgi:hypothetical protein
MSVSLKYIIDWVGGIAFTKLRTRHLCNTVPPVYSCTNAAPVTLLVARRMLGPGLVCVRDCVMMALWHHAMS